jgi:hypothetical protein
MFLRWLGVNMESITFIKHHGIKGMRWGVRRFQNPDGSLTDRGRRKYGSVEAFNKARSTRNKVNRGAKIGRVAGTAIKLGSVASVAYFASKGKTNFGMVKAGLKALPAAALGVTAGHMVQKGSKFVDGFISDK